MSTIFEIYALIDGVFATSRDLITKLKTPHDVTKETPPLRVKIAPDFHNEKGEVDLDDDTKIMVGVVNKILTNELRQKCENFFDVVGIFKGGGASIVAKEKGNPVQANKMFTAADKGWFTDETDAKSIVVHKTLEWLASDVILNPKVLHATGLDNADVLAKLLTFAKHTMDSLADAVYSETVEQKEILDIAIIQYPSSKDQVFRLLNVKLNAWIKRKVIGGGVYDISEVGIRGEFISYDFEPRKDSIKDLGDATKQKALDSFKTFADDLPKKLKESKEKSEGKDDA